MIQCLSPCFCIYSASTLHYCTKQARYNPQRGVNLQAPAFCLQAEKTVHPSQSLPKSVRLLKMPFLAPICTPLSNSEHCVRVVTLLRTELIVTEYLKKYLRQNEPWAKSRLWLPVFGVFLPVRWGVRVLLASGSRSTWRIGSRMRIQHGFFVPSASDRCGFSRCATVAVKRTHSKSCRFPYKHIANICSDMI